MLNKFTNFFKEVTQELKKVSWSTKDELVASTIVVITSVILLAIFIGICDVVCSRVINILIR